MKDFWKYLGEAAVTGLVVGISSMAGICGVDLLADHIRYKIKEKELNKMTEDKTAE